MISYPHVVSLSLTSVNIIQVEARLDGERDHFSRHYLEPVLGNHDGQFSAQGQDFSHTARNTHLDGSTLRAELFSMHRRWVASSAALDVVFPTQYGSDDVRVKVSTGFTVHTLAVRIPDPPGIERDSWSLRCCEHIWLYRMIPSLPISRSPCIDLGTCIGNNRGTFDITGALFQNSARFVHLSGTLLHAQLASAHGQWNNCSLDVAQFVRTQCAVGNPRFEAFNELNFQDDSIITARPSSTLARSPTSIYNSLKLGGPDAMRLCRIHKGGRDTRIECTLTAHRSSAERAYVCLSYVWGSPVDNLSILVNGKPHRATANLCSMLMDLRSRVEDAYYWIDALCINQQDLQEKSTQVARMDRIYREAERVTVWLSGGQLFADHTNAAGSVGESRLALFRTIIDHLAGGAHAREIPGLFGDVRKGMTRGPLFDAILSTLSDFSNEPWWERTWTFQEAILPEKVEFVFASTTLDWAHLARAAGNMKHHRDHCRSCSLTISRLGASEDYDLVAWADRIAKLNRCRESFRAHVVGQKLDLSQRKSSGGRMNGLAYITLRLPTRARPLTAVQTRSWSGALSLMTACGSSSSSDFRDKIYGLMALLPETGRRSLTVDYSLSVEQVYRDFTLQMMSWTHSYTIWSFQFNNDRKTTTLPSWVVDWRSGVDNRAVNDLQRNMALGDFAVTTTSWKAPREISFDVVSVECVLVDVVARVTLETWPAYSAGKSDAGDRFTQWTDFVHAAETTAYPTGEPLESVFWRTMLNDHIIGVREGEFVARKATAKDMGMWKAWVREVSRSPTIEPGSEKLKSDIASVDASVALSAQNKTLFAAAKGYLGLGPPSTRPNDVICTLIGGKQTFFLLRPVLSHRFHSETHPVFSLIGPAYVHGIMNGEVDGLFKKSTIIYLC